MSIQVTHPDNGWTVIEDPAWGVRVTISPRGIVHPGKVVGRYAIPRMQKCLERAFKEMKKRGKW